VVPEIMIGRDMMADRFFKLPPGFGSLGKKPAPVMSAGPLLLHGTGHFNLAVSGIAHHLAVIEQLVSHVPLHESSPVFQATLIVGERKSFKNDEVRVEIQRETVGYLPAHFVTRYTEWLRRWNYTNKQLRCHAIIERFFHERATSAHFAIKLDIAVPFRMTAIAE